MRVEGLRARVYEPGVRGESGEHGAYHDEGVSVAVRGRLLALPAKLDIRQRLECLRARHLGPHEVIKANIIKRTFRGRVWQWGLLFANCPLKR